MNNFLLVLLSLSLFSCKSNDVQPDNYDRDRIVFGTGGGFTGNVDQFCILDNGMLFAKTHRDTGFVYLKKIKENTGKQLIGNFETLGFNKLDTNKPGNVYRFLEYYTQDKNHQLTWNPYDDPDQESLNNYYNTLMQLFTVKDK